MRAIQTIYMPNYKNLFVVLALGILASCATTKVTERRINSAESEVIQKTLIADVKVDLTKKITGNSVLEGDDEELAKDMANWNALQFSDAHLVIDPIYKITLSGGTISCTVTAFSGYYDNIKVVTQ